MAEAEQMILCDTNILIEFYKNNPKVIQELRQIGQNQLAISLISQAELYFGALNKTELQRIKKHLSLLHQYPINIAISKRFLRLMETYSLSHKLSLPDAMIAATAIVYKLELYTLDARDFQFISGLKFYQPLSY